MQGSESLKLLYQRWLRNELNDEEITQFLQEQITDSQREEWHKLMEGFMEKGEPIPHFYRSRAVALSDRVGDRLMVQIREQQQQQQRTVRFIPWRKYAIAASCIAILGVCFGIWKSKYRDNSSAPMVTETSVDTMRQGMNAAMLVLADGRILTLDSTQQELVMDGQQLTYANGQTILDESDGLADPVQIQTLKVPRGSMCQITLSDGSLVKLNSDSELRFPTAFTGLERTVTLRGQAYFDIAKVQRKDGSRLPFVVHTGQQKIEVLGTRFVVSAYRAESINTTLAEGKVRVSTDQHSVVLKPGQRSVWRNGILEIESIDIDMELAWTRGVFLFEATDIHQIMEQLARWYDIDVRYVGKVEGNFGGRMSKDRPLVSVLNMLQSTGLIHFKIDGRRVYVSN